MLVTTLKQKAALNGHRDPYTPSRHSHSCQPITIEVLMPAALRRPDYVPYSQQNPVNPVTLFPGVRAAALKSIAPLCGRKQAVCSKSSVCNQTSAAQHNSCRTMHGLQTATPATAQSIALSRSATCALQLSICRLNPNDAELWHLAHLCCRCSDTDAGPGACLQHIMQHEVAQARCVLRFSIRNASLCQTVLV